MLLFAQRTTRLVLIKKTDLTERDGVLYLRLGNEPLLLPEPLGKLAVQLRCTPPDRETTTVNTNSQWLFPGHHRGSHLTADHLLTRIGRLGIKALLGRSQAVLQLGRTVPAAILADLLGYAGHDHRTLDPARRRRLDPLRDRPPPTRGHGPHSASALRAPAP